MRYVVNKRTLPLLFSSSYSVQRLVANTRLRTISQHRLALAHRVSFISYGRNVRLRSLLCAASPNHPCCTGAVHTSLNGRFRFCFSLHIFSSFMRVIFDYSSQQEIFLFLDLLMDASQVALILYME